VSVLIQLPSTIRGVVFDAVGTIIRPEPQLAVVYQECGRSFGVELPQAEILARFLAEFRREDERDRAELDWNDSDAREAARWRAIVAAVFGDRLAPPLLDEAFARLWMHYSRPESWRVYDDVAPLWERLRHRGLRIGIGSNYDSRLLSVVAGLEPLARHEGLFISSLVGTRKPGEAFYRHIATEWSMAPAELAFLGDDWENDVAAPRAAGWHAWHLNRHGEKIATSPFTAENINSFAELA